jgi:hypothetical protein
MLGSGTFLRGSGSTDDITVYVTFSGHLAALESPTWWGRALFTTRLEMNVRVPRLHTVVRGTPVPGYRHIYGPQLKYSHWTKDFCSLRHTGQSGAMYVRHKSLDLASDRWRCQPWTRQFGVTPSSPGSPSQCHQELAIELLYPGAPDSLVLSAGRSANGSTFLHVLDFA